MPSGSKVRSKKLLRLKMRQKIALLGRSVRKKKSRRIHARLLKHPAYREARHVMTYISLPSEVETGTLIARMILQGKKIYAPRLKPRGRVFDLFEIRDPRRDLKPGAFGILEPRSKPGRHAGPGKMDLFLVPGLAFDRKGGRLGRGLGYFDRFLARAPRAPKLGLAFREQMVMRVPMEEHDVRLDGIVTD